MTDENIAAIARRLASAAANNAYERDADTAKNFRNALTELCAAVKMEMTDASVECPHCHWGFHPSVIDQHIREKHQ